MGQEIATKLRYDGRVHDGTAVLETDSIVFEGGISLTLRFNELTGIEASGGSLELRTMRGLAIFELGPKAQAWAEKIKNPKGLLEKLGVKPGDKTACLGTIDLDFRADLERHGARITETAGAADLDLVFIAGDAKKDLDHFVEAKALIKDAGTIWVIYPKGRQDIRELDVLLLGRAAGLTDNKVVRFSETHSASRFVIPVAARKARKKGK